MRRSCIIGADYGAVGKVVESINSRYSLEPVGRG